DPEPARTSVWAITALVVSIISCILCFVPAPGAIAMVLGGVAVFFIATSGGRRTGMGLAVTAIVLGLLQSVLWVFVMFAMIVPGTNWFHSNFVVPSDRLM